MQCFKWKASASHFLLTESSCLGRILTNYKFQDNNCWADRRRHDSHRRHRWGDRCLYWYRNRRLPVVASGHTFWDVTPGDYTLSMVEPRFEGGRGGAGTFDLENLRAMLILRHKQASGQGALETRYTPLYGWTDIDLKGVAAPICLEDPYPLPSSQDPVFPGVLVLKLDPEWKLASRVCTVRRHLSLSSVRLRICVMERCGSTVAA